MGQYDAHQRSRLEGYRRWNKEIDWPKNNQQGWQLGGKNEDWSRTCLWVLRLWMHATLSSWDQVLHRGGEAHSSCMTCILTPMILLMSLQLSTVYSHTPVRLLPIRSGMSFQPWLPLLLFSVTWQTQLSEPQHAIHDGCQLLHCLNPFSHIFSSILNDTPQSSPL